jgi:hypothetical protein
MLPACRSFDADGGLGRGRRVEEMEDRRLRAARLSAWAERNGIKRTSLDP